MQHNNYIRTERLLIRHLGELDLNYILTWRNHEDIRKWFINKEVISLKQHLQWYHKYLTDKSDMMFVVEETLNIKGPVGALALYKIDTAERSAEFGRFMIGNFEARGKGFALECLNAICDFAFTKLNLKRVYLEVFENNINAIKVYEKAGFKRINTYQKNGANIVYMELIKGMEAGMRF